MQIKFQLGFSSNTVALYVFKGDDKRMVKANCALELPRDIGKGEADGNVQLLRTLEAAGAERVRQLILDGKV